MNFLLVILIAGFAIRSGSAFQWGTVVMAEEEEPNDDSQFWQYLLAKICTNIPSMERNNVIAYVKSHLAGFEERGVDMDKFLPIMSSHVHFLIDLFETSDVSRNQFMAKCDDYATHLNNVYYMLDDSTHTPFTSAKLYSIIEDMCPDVSKVKHEDVGRMTAYLVKDTLSELPLETKDNVLILAQWMMHFLLVHYYIQKDLNNDDFNGQCKDGKKLVSLLFRGE